MKIIRERQIRESECYSRIFHWEGYPGAGFSFQCDQNGNVLDLREDALANYRDCLTGHVGGRKVVDCGIEHRAWHYTDPAVGICEYCGEELELAGYTNTCLCGTDYNSGGQELAPRSQWGEETGESVCDILQADASPWDGDQ